jgi:hypothetical protein
MAILPTFLSEHSGKITREAGKRRLAGTITQEIEFDFRAGEGNFAVKSFRRSFLSRIHKPNDLLGSLQTYRHFFDITRDKSSLK